MRNLYNFIKSREYTDKYEPLLKESMHQTFLQTLNYEYISTKCNKIYCSYWINDYLIVYGTKNKLLNLYNCNNGKTTLIQDYRTEQEKTNMELIIESIGIKSIDYQNNKLIVSVNNSIEIFNFEFNKCVAGHSFKSHTDWISKIKYGNYNKIITSSKDKTIRLWNDYGVNTKIYEYSNNYCRDFQYNNINNQLYCISSNGIVKYIDIIKNKSYSKLNLNTEECVVSEYNDVKKLFIIGTKDSVIFVDTRRNKKSSEIPNMNSNMGTRSLGWYNENILSIGGGNNNLSFYDIRKNIGFIKMNDNRNYYQVNTGYIENNDIYQIISNNLMIEDNISIYTHTYNRHKTRIFVAGGPTTSALFGSQISIFQ